MFSPTFRLKPGESAEVAAHALKAKIAELGIEAEVTVLESEPVKVQVQYGEGISLKEVDAYDEILDEVLEDVLGRKA